MLAPICLYANAWCYKKKKSISTTDNMAIYDLDTDSTVPAANS